MNVIIEFYTDEEESKTFLNFILFFELGFISQATYVAIDISSKKIMDLDFVDPLVNCFLQGIFGLCITSAFILIFSYFPCPEIETFYCEDDKTIAKSFLSLFSELGSWYALSFFFLFLLSVLFFNVSRILTIYKYSPLHIIMPETIAIFIYWLIQFFKKVKIEGTLEFWIYFPLFFLSISGTLVFLEIIILKFFNLDQNTKKYISEREQNDILISEELLKENSKKKENNNSIFVC